MSAMTRNAARRVLQFTPQARFWGEVRNDRVDKTVTGPDGQNPIATKTSPRNAAQPWLQHTACGLFADASNIVTDVFAASSKLA
jgi:hypothetical protein